jgi:hypothetical protein
MPTPATEKTGNILPGSNEQARAGKEKAGARTEPQAAPRSNSRRTKVREDIDPDYAEEAEDFFYGEGM